MNAWMDSVSNEKIKKRSDLPAGVTNDGGLDFRHLSILSHSSLIKLSLHFCFPYDYHQPTLAKFFLGEILTTITALWRNDPQPHQTQKVQRLLLAGSYLLFHSMSMRHHGIQVMTFGNPLYHHLLDPHLQVGVGSLQRANLGEMAGGETSSESEASPPLIPSSPAHHIPALTLSR